MSPAPAYRLESSGYTLSSSSCLSPSFPSLSLLSFTSCYFPSILWPVFFFVPITVLCLQSMQKRRIYPVFISGWNNPRTAHHHKFPVYSIIRCVLANIHARGNSMKYRFNSSTAWKVIGAATRDSVDISRGYVTHI